MLNRRRFVFGTTVGALAAFGSARAQTPNRVYRVGLLLSGPAAVKGSPVMDSLTRHLSALGYLLDRNLVYESRGAQNRVERLPQLVDELVASKVDVILLFGYPAARAAKLRAATVPVVILGAGDPVAGGLVDSLARPGGNLTGMSDVSAELAPKRLQLLKEVAPKLRRIAMLWNVGDLAMTLRYEASAGVARSLGVVVQPYGVREPGDFDVAFAAMTHDPPDALLMVADPFTNLNRRRVIAFAEARRLPAMYEVEANVSDGGLMSYGLDREETFERGAAFVDRILKGARPAQLPFEQPTRFVFALNLKTAKALGINVPQSLLLQATKVIE